MEGSLVPQSLKVRLERLALSQHGLVTYAEAIKIGAHRQYLSRRPEWTIIRSGLYRQTAHPTSWRQDLMAAVLVGGEGALVSHRAAALLHGLDGVFGEVVEITVGPRGKNRNLPGVVVHRGPPVERIDRTRRDGIALTSVTRTLIDLGSVVGADELESALECALRRRWTSISLLRQRLSVLGRRGRPGTASLRRLLASRRYAPPTGSELETRFLQLCRRAGLPEGVRQSEVGSARVDFAWPASQVIVELDGYASHGTPADHDADMQRLNGVALARPDWVVLHYGWYDVTQCCERVMKELGRALASAG